VQLFGTSFNFDLGRMRLHISIGLDERAADAATIRVEDMPRFEVGVASFMAGSFSKTGCERIAGRGRG